LIKQKNIFSSSFSLSLLGVFLSKPHAFLLVTEVFFSSTELKELMDYKLRGWAVS